MQIRFDMNLSHELHARIFEDKSETIGLTTK